MEERPPIWRVAANILNNQSRRAAKGWSSNIGVWRGFVLLGKSEGERPLETPRRRQKDKITRILKREYGGTLWIDLT
jgi:hypothetical protein